jgi:hypothetical protein
LIIIADFLIFSLGGEYFPNPPEVTGDKVQRGTDIDLAIFIP